MKTIPPAPEAGKTPEAAAAEAGPKIEYDKQGRAGVWREAPRSLRGDLEGLNRQSDAWAKRQADKIRNIDAQTDDWWNGLKNYVGGGN